MGLFRLPLAATVFLAEALAIREALIYVSDRRSLNATVLTDSLSVLWALQSSTPGADTHELIVDIRRSLIHLMEDQLDPHLY